VKFLRATRQRTKPLARWGAAASGIGIASSGGERPVLKMLRRRMIEDMTIRRLSPKTQQGYIRTIKNLAAFLGRSPDKASFEDIRRFQLHVAQSGVGTGALNATVTALRFFFRVTLKRSAIIEHTAFIHEPRKLPVVLSPDEMARLLDAAPGLKYRAALSVAYGAGLRASEVVSLKISDIDSERMVIRVEQGKSLPPRRRGVARTDTSRCLR
jgi:integrase/recombinase XerD